MEYIGVLRRQIFLALVLLAVSVWRPDSIEAHTWQYRDNADAFTGAVSEANVWLEKKDDGKTVGYIWLGCHWQESSGQEPHEKEFQISVVVDADVFAAAREITRQPVSVTWRVDDGEVMEFVADGYDGGYMVGSQKSLELGQTLVDAKQFETSDGNGAVRFDNLHGGELLERVLDICADQ